MVFPSISIMKSNISRTSKGRLILLCILKTKIPLCGSSFSATRGNISFKKHPDIIAKPEKWLLPLFNAPLKFCQAELCLRREREQPTPQIVISLTFVNMYITSDRQRFLYEDTFQGKHQRFPNIPPETKAMKQRAQHL